MGNLKGNKGEREVAGMLQAWWRPLEPECKFVRVPMSGAYVYGPDFDMCGDIMTNARLFPFSLEVKRRERWDFDNLMAGRRCPVWGWWRQCQADAAKTGREPMLWFRHNRRRWLVLVRLAYVRRLRGVDPPDAAWARKKAIETDVGALPALYLGERLLLQKPWVFERGIVSREMAR